LASELIEMRFNLNQSREAKSVLSAFLKALNTFFFFSFLTFELKTNFKKQK